MKPLHPFDEEAAFRAQVLDGQVVEFRGIAAVRSADDEHQVAFALAKVFGRLLAGNGGGTDGAGDAERGGVPGALGEESGDLECLVRRHGGLIDQSPLP